MDLYYGIILFLAALTFGAAGLLGALVYLRGRSGNRFVKTSQTPIRRIERVAPHVGPLSLIFFLIVTGSPASGEVMLLGVAFGSLMVLAPFTLAPSHPIYWSTNFSLGLAILTLSTACLCWLLLLTIGVPQ